MNKKILLIMIACFMLTFVKFEVCRGECGLNCSGDLKFKTIELGAGSHYPAENFVVIRNQKEWDRVWKTYKGKELNDDSEEATPPKVDFAKKMLIGVFGGRQPALNYTILIDKITVKDEKFVVHVVKNGPSHSIGRPIVMSPCHIVSVPRSNYAVKFIINGSPSEVMPNEITLE